MKGSITASFATAISATCIISGYFPLMPAMGSEPVPGPTGSTAAQNAQDYVAVDVETRTPEGSVGVYSKIYARRGDQYTNTLGESIAASYVEKVRQYAIESESNQAVDLAQYGINPQSVRKKVDEFLKANKLASIDPKKYPHPNFDQLDPAVRKLFDYDTVAHAASEAISHPINTGYFIMHVYISGDRPVELQSRHEGGGMVPWTVKVGSKVWQTPSLQLPALLADLGNNGFLRGKHADWFDNFFNDYSAKIQGQNRPSIEDKESDRSIAALPSGCDYPTAKDQPYSYFWPVDFDKAEDAEYLDRKMGDESIVIYCPKFAPSLVGEIDKGGKPILQPVYQFLGPTSDGMTAFRLSKGKTGYLNEAGEVAIDPQYDEAEAFHEGLAAVGKDHKYGFIDTKGNVVIPMVFDAVRQFAEGVAPARVGASFGYIDKTGKFVIEPQFGRARHFINGLAYVQNDWRRAYIDHTGKPIGGRFYERLERFSCDRAKFKQDGKFGYIDRAGKAVIPARYDDADDFRDGVAKVEINGVAKGIDVFGKSVPVPPEHSDFWAGPISEGLMDTTGRGKNAMSHGLMDRNGKFVIKPIYESVGAFVGGLCPVQINDKWGVIDRSGKMVIKPQFDETTRLFSDNRLGVKIGKKWGLIDATGSMILEPKYDAIWSFKNGMAIVQSGIKFGYIDKDGVEVIPPIFDAAHQFGPSGRARVRMRVEPVDLGKDAGLEID